jgi:hypothetical protein
MHCLELAALRNSACATFIDMTTTIYYLPGYGGRLHTGLGKELLDRGFDVSGRETVGEFRSLPFQAQIEAVAEDLTTLFWHESHQVVCNSFGCYLFLHAQTLMKPYVGKVLLLSPIVGEFSDEATSGLGFIPPRADRLAMLAKAGAYPVPKRCEIQVGELDWQSNPANVIHLANFLGLPVNVVPQGGHMLEKRYVSAVLDRWLV